MRIQVLYLFILFPLILFSQEYSISGVVRDINSNPISYANVVISNSTDSSLIRGTISDEDGFFEIDYLQPDDYILKTSFLGFKTQNESISLNKNTVLNIILVEEEQELGEIEILVKRPTVTKKPDRLIFNIENTSLNEGSHLGCIKKSTPGVIGYE